MTLETFLQFVADSAVLLFRIGVIWVLVWIVVTILAAILAFWWVGRDRERLRQRGKARRDEITRRWR